jgi:hypothetical protein
MLSGEKEVLTILLKRKGEIMFDYLTIGSSPIEEDCVQVNPNVNYIPAMKEECSRFKKLLEEKFPIPENLVGKVYFQIKSFPHDFGTYYEVVVMYDDKNSDAEEFAVNVENNTPLKWNDSNNETL